jgi:uncharacterized protein DUF4922
VANELAGQLQTLWDGQKHEWPMMTRGVEFLAQSEVRGVAFDGLRCNLQFNPGRVASASAKVDAKSIAARPCFLCEKNRPAEQRGIDAGDGYVFLCNPMPIFDPHFTVPTLEHQPQRIHTCLPKMLELAEQLTGQYTVFYNGPKCGASAPDHLHLQASPFGVTPFEQQLIADTSPKPGHGPQGLGRDASTFINWSENDNDVTVGITADPEPPAIVITGNDRAAVQDRVIKTIAHLDEHFGGDPEPMLNVMALHTNGTLRVTLFPRVSHRPSNFGHDPAPTNVLVSPGLVDMLGLLITPRREDFDQLTGEAVAKIYREVSRERGDLISIT